MSLRVTHRSLFSTNLANLQTNLSRIQSTQGRLSSGKVIEVPSDSPAGTSAALQHRSSIAQGEQFKRNADDGLGWLTNADAGLADSIDTMGRVRDLLVQASNPLGEQAWEAVAAEVEELKGTMLSIANREYLGRPIFSGNADVDEAYDAAGVYQGDAGVIKRSVRAGVDVQVNVTGEQAFGAAGDDVFSFLDEVVNNLRTDPGALSGNLADADRHLSRIMNSLSSVGARYRQVESMVVKNDDDVLRTRSELSGIEDIDLPATIVELQLQETAYQAALSATARSVQPSLLDFLR